MTYAGSPEWDLAERGEARVRRWLFAEGFAVVRLAAIEEGGAPMLRYTGGHAVLPDLLAFRNGLGRWVEVKTKTAAVEWRKTGEVRHGIEEHLWPSYGRVQHLTGIEVWIAVVEKAGDVIVARWADLDAVAEEHHGGGARRVWFPRSAFRAVTVR